MCFCGGGEGEQIVKDNKTSHPGGFGLNNASKEAKVRKQMFTKDKSTVSKESKNT